MLESMQRMVDSVVNAAFREPVSLFVGLVVGILIGYLTGHASGRYSR